MESRSNNIKLQERAATLLTTFQFANSLPSANLPWVKSVRKSLTKLPTTSSLLPISTFMKESKLGVAGRIHLGNRLTKLQWIGEILKILQNPLDKVQRNKLLFCRIKPKEICNRYQKHRVTNFSKFHFLNGTQLEDRLTTKRVNAFQSKPTTQCPLISPQRHKLNQVFKLVSTSAKVCNSN